MSELLSLKVYPFTLRCLSVGLKGILRSIYSRTNFGGSNTDGSFTTAVSKLFLSP